MPTRSLPRSIQPARPVIAARGAASTRTVRLARTYASRKGFAWLETLWDTIRDRRETRPGGSYTTTLLDGGVDAVGRKVTEEATEVLMAAKDDAAAEAGGLDRSATRAALAEEIADLAFHTLVLMAERREDPARVITVLERRHGAARPPKPTG